tara:strand:+ start:2523 stop:2837 length:315 start_codon:yes stop_codon:yes gene_type:complete
MDTINMILLGGLLYTIYTYMFLKEGLEGCPANFNDKSRDRSRSAKRDEIDNTIANMKAEIANLNLRITTLNIGVTANKRELEKVSDAAARKAKETQKKMDEVKS